MMWYFHTRDQSARTIILDLVLTHDRYVRSQLNPSCQPCKRQGQIDPDGARTCNQQDSALPQRHDLLTAMTPSHSSHSWPSAPRVDYDPDFIFLLFLEAHSEASALAFEPWSSI
jgi:hypothetical protein